MAIRRAIATSNRDPGTNRTSLAGRRVWLPTLLYEALPYLYLTAGFIALFATLYIGDWYWVVPYYLLFAGFCLHLGIHVWRRRRRERLRP